MKYILTLYFSLLCLSCSCQEIICNNKSVEAAYKLAINTVDINTRRGILAAGSDYGGEWTRDISINSLNGVSLLRPIVAKKSLWSVTINKDSIGHQYWDKIIWVIGAYNHYKVTGDKQFLNQMFHCSINTIKELEKNSFDSNYGLFTGPSVFNDGISGYPESVFDSLNNSSYVLDHKGTEYLKCLSTNCVYYEAYEILSKICKTLNDEQRNIEYSRKASYLKANILHYLCDLKSHKFYYLIDSNGNIDKSQEALGLSYAVLFGVINKKDALLFTEKASVSQYGITSIYPDFKRYSKDMPGRHNNLIWPFVNGFYAQACYQTGNFKSFEHEFFSSIKLALDEDKGNYNFREIFNPNSGKPDGGWQSGHVWVSCNHQTWSATAYLSMIIHCIFGMDFNEKGINFKPYLPSGIKTIELKNLHYQNTVLSIKLIGTGHNIKKYIVNGRIKKYPFIGHDNKGATSIIIEMK